MSTYQCLDVRKDELFYCFKDSNYEYKAAFTADKFYTLVRSNFPATPFFQSDCGDIPIYTIGFFLDEHNLVPMNLALERHLKLKLILNI